MHKDNRFGYSVFLWIFVVSGFAGLIYQSIWSHYLGLFLGHAAYAQALVLSIFMGGMACGAIFVSRWGWRWRNLLRVYAVAELLIGAAGLVFHIVFVWVLDFSYSKIIPSLGSSAEVEVYKWLVAGVLIFPQTILLGMTFPLMSAGVIRKFPGSEGKSLGGLYFANSIGAALGVLVAAFIFLPTVGLSGASLIAAILNILVAFAAWGVSLSESPKILSEKKLLSTSKAGTLEKKTLVLVLAATFLSGGASFAYEIIWVRMLGMAVGSTFQAFEIMLASFIAGIALGGLWVRKRAPKSNLLRLVGWMQLFMGLAALSSLYFYAYAFEWVGFLYGALNKNDQGYLLYNVGTAMVSIAIMMPAAFFAGTTLPLLTMALMKRGGGEQVIGQVYAWNTLGAIAGVLIFTHLIIPTLGLKLSLMMAAAIDIGVGGVLLRLHVKKSLSFRRYGLAAGLAVLVFAVVLVKVPFDPLQVSSGVFRHGKSSLADGTEVLFYKDGKTASVASTLSKAGIVSITTNGKPDASIALYSDKMFTPDEPTMVLAAAIPMAYLDEPKRAGVIGFGSGLTTHSLLANEDLIRVDTIEIEASMIEGAKVFGTRVARAYDDPRSNVVIQDAKSYFSQSREKYDVIVSEPSNPWISGVGSLFSKEFYSLVPRFLSPDGVFVQWLQLYEIDDALVGSVLNAMIPEFMDYHAYLANNGDLLIVAGTRELDSDVDFSNLFAGDMKDDLKRVGITDSKQISFRRVADGRMMRALARLYPSDANSDYFPILSMNAPRTRFRKDSANALLSLSVHSIPALEMLGVSQPLDLNVPVGEPGSFLRADMTGRARNIANDYSGLESNLQYYKGGVELAVDVHQPLDCASMWSPKTHKVAVRKLRSFAEEVLAFSPSNGGGQPILGSEFTDCSSIPRPILLISSFIEAAARRDKGEIVSISQLWFTDSEVRADELLTSSFDSIVLGWWQLVLAVRGDAAQFKHVESLYAGGLKGADQYSILSATLLAWLDEESVR